jgi:DNA/RNA endonuclease G, NUC1
MAPNYAIGRTFGEKAQKETFLLTNIVPQKPNMNRGLWKDMEQYIANDLAKKYGSVLVFIGPVLEQPVARLKGKVAVPTACFAILMVKPTEKDMYAIGFIVPQEPTKKSFWDYCVPIDRIEEVTGIDFFSQLLDETERSLESNTSIKPFKNPYN